MSIADFAILDPKLVIKLEMGTKNVTNISNKDQNCKINFFGTKIEKISYSWGPKMQLIQPNYKNYFYLRSMISKIPLAKMVIINQNVINTLPFSCN